MKRGAALVCFAAVIICGVMATAQQDTTSGESSIELGATVGLFWFTDTPQLATVGVVLGVAVSPGLGMRVSGSRAAVSLFGFELLSVTVVSVSICAELTPGNSIGLYLLGGGSYIMANALGVGLSGLGAHAGIGLRVTPTPTLKFFAEYCPHIKNDLMHAAKAGVSVIF